MSGLTISAELAEWMRGGEQGLSSRFMVEHLLGVPLLGKTWGGTAHHPHDPSDLIRCALLLESVPEVRERFEEMASASRAWSRLANSWPVLVATLNEEAPEWRLRRGGSAPRTYALMRKVLND